ncbi:hypothetical protein AWB71_02517 [Caballeronia peredens]|nr:hypothetical protein AWB71_02517 [Caballeronia peredens]
MKRIGAWLFALLLGMLVSGCGGNDSAADAVNSSAKDSAGQSNAQMSATDKGSGLSTVIWK